MGWASVEDGALRSCCPGPSRGGLRAPARRQGPSLQATHRRPLPDELDGELLAVKERGLIRWELRIQIENLLVQTLLMKLLECLLLHSNDGKIAADDGRIDATGVRAPGLGGPALVRGGNWPRGPGLGPRPWGHRCADDGGHGRQTGGEEVSKENKTRLPARGGSRGGEVGGTVSSERKMSTSTFEAEAHQMVTQRLPISKAPRSPPLS